MAPQHVPLAVSRVHSRSLPRRRRLDLVSAVDQDPALALEPPPSEPLDEVAAEDQLSPEASASPSHTAPRPSSLFNASCSGRYECPDWV